LTNKTLLRQASTKKKADVPHTRGSRQKHSRLAVVTKAQDSKRGHSRTADVPRRSRLRLRQRKMSKWLHGKIRQARYLLILLVGLVVADGLISNFIVQNGLGKEGNPFIQNIVGQSSFVFIKLVGAFISAIILWRVIRKHTRLGLVSIIFYIVVYTTILWLNLMTWFIASHNL
jgi:hypothetical protein